MMRAVRIHDYGTTEVLCHEDAPTSEPGPRDVLIRVHAAGVNPADRQIRAGLRHRLEKPFALTLGCEVSGIVGKRWTEVTELAVMTRFTAGSSLLRRPHTVIPALSRNPQIAGAGFLLSQE
jgi:NADPH:quinone reductase-like Zn-dependent oxidoreductase